MEKNQKNKYFNGKRKIRKENPSYDEEKRKRIY